MTSPHANRHRAWLERCLREGLPPFPWAGEWGLRFLDLTEGGASLELDVDARHHNPAGVVHGGALFFLLDTAFGFAATSILQGPQRASTVDVNVKFVRAVVKGRLRAEGRVVHQARRVAHLEGRVVDQTGELVALATGSAVLSEEKDATS